MLLRHVSRETVLTNGLDRYSVTTFQRPALDNLQLVAIPYHKSPKRSGFASSTFNTIEVVSRPVSRGGKTESTLAEP